ncbi:hypothetical protein ACFWIP_24855 [Streptomyces anulatus]|uniref:hypothetical protein n=1 Tax=Streptomyces anulatus TaxID=1892 RepID=UPI00364AA6A7
MTQPPLDTPALDAAAVKFIAERLDIYRMAHVIASQTEWANGLDVVDVVALARFLAGDATE